MIVSSTHDKLYIRRIDVGGSCRQLIMIVFTVVLMNLPWCLVSSAPAAFLDIHQRTTTTSSPTIIYFPPSTAPRSAAASCRANLSPSNLSQHSSPFRVRILPCQSLPRRPQQLPVPRPHRDAVVPRQCPCEPDQ